MLLLHSCTPQAIRNAADGTAARQQLCDTFHLSERQAEGVLSLTLRRLTAMEAGKLQEEQRQLQATISDLQVGFCTTCSGSMGECDCPGTHGACLASQQEANLTVHPPPRHCPHCMTRASPLLQGLLGDRQRVLAFVKEEAAAVAAKHGSARRSVLEVSHKQGGVLRCMAGCHG